MQGRTTSGSSTSPNARVAPLQIFTNSHYGIPQTSPNTEAYTPLIPPVPRGLTADTNSVHWQHISPHLQGFAPATQNILLNLDTIRNDIGPGNAAWDAAREQVMNSMKSTSDNRGRGTYSGRGRPPTHVRMHPRGALPPTLSAETSPTPIHSNAPTLDSYETPKRGRGRGGRPRGRGRGRGTGRGRGGKRRRDSDDEGAIVCIHRTIEACNSLFPRLIANDSLTPRTTTLRITHQQRQQRNQGATFKGLHNLIQHHRRLHLLVGLRDVDHIGVDLNLLCVSNVSEGIVRRAT